MTPVPMGSTLTAMREDCKYRLFIDDERDPVEDDWVIARSYDEAVTAVLTRGMPYMISFDHDLGEDSKDAYEFVKWLVDRDLENDFIDEGFSFFVHSQNPVGKTNIEGYLGQYLEFKFEGISDDAREKAHRVAMRILRQHSGFAQSLTEGQLEEIENYDGPETVGKHPGSRTE